MISRIKQSREAWEKKWFWCVKIKKTKHFSASPVKWMKQGQGRMRIRRMYKGNLPNDQKKAHPLRFVIIIAQTSSATPWRTATQRIFVLPLTVDDTNSSNVFPMFLNDANYIVSMRFISTGESIYKDFSPPLPSSTLQGTKLVFCYSLDN